MINQKRLFALAVTITLVCSLQSIDADIFLLKNDVNTLPLAPLFTPINTEMDIPLFSFDNQNVRVSYANEVKSGVVDQLLSIPSGWDYSRTRILAIDKSPAFYSLVLQEKSVVAFKVQMSGLIDPANTQVFATNNNDPLIDAKSDKTGSFLYLASLNKDGNIDVKEFDLTKQTDRVITISQAGIASPITKDGRITILEFTQGESTQNLITVSQRNWNTKSKTSTVILYADFTGNSTGNLDLGTVQALTNANQIFAFNCLPKSKVGITTIDPKSQEFTSFVCQSTYGNSAPSLTQAASKLAIQNCVKVIRQTPITSSTGAQVITFGSDLTPQIFVFDMTDAKNKFLSVADIDDDGKTFNQLSSTNIALNTINTQPVEFFVSHLGFVTIMVVDKNGKQSDGFTLISSIKKLNQNLVYKQFTQPRSVAGIENNGSTVFFRSTKSVTSYNTYQDNINAPNLIIPGSGFSNKPTIITVKRIVHSATETSQITVQVMDSLSDLSSINPNIPTANWYADDSFNVVPVNRATFSGNNLQFSLNDGKSVGPSNFLNLNELKYTFEASINTIDEISFTTTTAAVARIGNKLFLVTCDNDYTKLTSYCTDFSKGDDQYRYTLGAGEQLIYTTSSEFVNEKGSIAVLSDGKDSTFVFLGELYQEVYSIKRQGLALKAGDVFFKLSGKHYAFWIRQDKQITILAVYNKELTAMRDSPFNVIDETYLKNKQTYDQFCPQQISKNPNDASFVDVHSDCDGENRWMTFNALNITDGLTVDQNIYINNEGDGDVQDICNTGDELLYFNTGSNTLIAQPLGNPNSKIDLSVQDAGFKTLTGLKCIRDSNAAIVYGTDINDKQIMSVIYGKIENDARSRYHSTVNYEGSIYGVASQGGAHLLITLSTKTSEQSDDLAFKFIHVFLNGPYLILQNGTTQLAPSSTQALNILQGGKVVGTQNISINYNKFDSSVKFDPRKDGLTPPTDKGVYSIDQLGSLQGPIYGITVTDTNKVSQEVQRLLENSKVGAVQPGKVTVIPPITPQTPQPSQSSVNTPLPSRIYSSTKHPFKVGTLTNTMSSLAIYYNNDAYMYLEDIGYYAVKNHAAFLGGKLGYFLWIGITQEGGEYYLRWMTKTVTQNGFAGKNVDSLTRITSDFNFRENSEYNLNFQEVGDNKLLIITGQLRWLVSVGRDSNQNWYLSNPQKLIGFDDKVEILSSVLVDLRTTLVYTIENDPKIYTSIVDQSGNVTPSGNITPTITEKIDEIGCRSFQSGSSCVVFYNGIYFNDYMLSFDEYTNQISITFGKKYSQFQNYQPNYVEWSENYLVIKARTPMLNRNQVETVVAYSRKGNFGDQIDVGIKSTDYFKFIDGYTDTKITPSIPFLYTDSTGSQQLRFTQSQTQPQTTQYNPLTVGYSIDDDPSFKIQISDKIWKKAASNISLVFDESNPQSSIKLDQMFTTFPDDPNGGSSGGNSSNGPGWYFWVVLGLFIIVLLLFIREKVKNNPTEGEDNANVSDYNKMSIGAETGRDDQGDLDTYSKV